MKTIIFDFDYTLADSSKGVYECINYAFYAMGKPARSWEECCDTIGLPLNMAYDNLTGDVDPEREKEFFRLFVERADQVMAKSTELYEGVPEMINELRRRKYSLGILSAKFRYRINQILSSYDLATTFTAIVGGEDVEHPKPHPEGLRLLLSKIGSRSREAALVGDSLTDAETARQGGIPFIAVLTGQTGQAEFMGFNPLAVLKSVIDLPGALKISTESSIRA